MKVEVLYFSQVKDKVGKSSEIVDFNGNTVEDLINYLTKIYPNIRDILQKSMIAVNENYAEKDSILNENDKVAIIPPVSGG
ncbi:conserved domain protein [Sulfurihydrogenibium azorense Az-Fu1]|jgi:molybdopterin synthase sulfur carrier subunit|uniref:Molybdopterin synthase sulfur carrier subunit n=1 Tax=Sulfurihydrogenibium azorense (strain DSM 15241 / OCM 825 / Az-Fu1) TaxID=204536 RepID=C1DXG3_SULAA|nr:molybdopterin converting factor subunit 1 [Sulfurihydrogenibium azorense]ACN99052.1 conserved domain protein [Sulfurihydrogenibium azorense Az-Fu1]